MISVSGIGSGSRGPLDVAETMQSSSEEDSFQSCERSGRSQSAAADDDNQDEVCDCDVEADPNDDEVDDDDDEADDGEDKGPKLLRSRKL